MKRELDAAGIYDDHLRAAYAECRAYLRRRGTAAYPATRSLLPPGRRPFWDAIIAFTTYVDSLLDDPNAPVAERAIRFDGYVQGFEELTEGDDPWLGNTGHGPQLARAFAHFAAAWRLPQASVRLSLSTVRSDLYVTHYETFADLADYIAGVCVQGTLWGVPLFDPRDERAAACAAAAMSFGLQLTDYIRDLRADLEDGRLYLPLEDLDRFGLRRADVERAATAGRMTPELRELVHFELERARRYLDEASRLRHAVHPAMREMPRMHVALARAEVNRIARDRYDVFQPSWRRRRVSALRGGVSLGAARLRARVTWLLNPPPPPGPTTSPTGEVRTDSYD